MPAKPTRSIALHFRDDVESIRNDLSGVVLAPGGTLWLASDETRSIERLTQNDGRFEHHKHFELDPLLGLPPGDDREFDLEGLDLDGGYLWFVGGFGARRKDVEKGKTDAENIRRLVKVESQPDRYLVGRVPLDGDELVASAPPRAAARLDLSGGIRPLIEALAVDDHLGRFLKADIPSKDNGLDVEGLAVTGSRVLLGLRGPVLRGWAILLELEVQDTAPGVLGLKPLGAGGRPYRKYFVDLQGLGVRDLCRDGADLLVLAGPSMIQDGPFRVYRLAGAGGLSEDVLHRPTFLFDLPHGRGDDHPEGMTLADDRSLLVVYDSPSVTRLRGDRDVLADIFDRDSTSS